MRIVENLAVHRHNRRIDYTSRRDDNLISWVAVKFAGKLSGLDADARRKIDQPNARIRERLLKPIEYRTRKTKSFVLDEFGDLPARNHAHGDAGLLGGIEQSPGGRRKCRVSMYPPNPDVRIENNQRAASQSASATGSVGERSVTGVPRSG